jgi:Legionella pneumophila major outer membrane protein precursor
MKAGWLLTLAALALAGAGAPMRAQEVLVPYSDLPGARAAGQFTLLPADGTNLGSTPLFLDAGGTTRVATSGTIGGLAATSSNGRLSVGFDYLRPWWSFRDFTMAIPPGYAAAFPAFPGVGHTDGEFAFVPLVRYDYHVADMGIDFGAAGTFLGLSGRFQRNVAATGSTAGDMVVSYDLTLISVIPVQAARRFDAAELFAEKGHDVEAGVFVDLSIGTRFAALDQNYTSTVHAAGANGVNIATRTTSQNFRGIGLTAAGGWQVPAGQDWVAFLGARGSILIGDNQRSSSATVVAPGFPAFADTISESRTTLVPVVEAEAGVEWGTDLGDRLARGEVPPQFCVRLALVGQYWGGMGPLSAGSTQGFRTNDLFLAGVSVQIGLRQ